MNDSHDGRMVADPLLINASQLAALMNISTRTLWRLLSAGQVVKPIRVGGNTRWRFHEVSKWIESGCPPPHSSEQ